MTTTTAAGAATQATNRASATGTRSRAASTPAAGTVAASRTSTVPARARLLGLALGFGLAYGAAAQHAGAAEPAAAPAPDPAKAGGAQMDGQGAAADRRAASGNATQSPNRAPGSGAPARSSPARADTAPQTTSAAAREASPPPAHSTPEAAVEALARAVAAGDARAIGDVFTDPFRSALTEAVLAGDHLAGEAVRARDLVEARFGKAAVGVLGLDGALQPYRPFGGRVEMVAVERGEADDVARASLRCIPDGDEEELAAVDVVLELRRAADGGWRLLPGRGPDVAVEVARLQALRAQSLAAASRLSALCDSLQAGRYPTFEALCKGLGLGAAASGEQARRSP